MRRVVIIGGGFSGLFAARRLRKSDPNIEITLIDKKQGSDFLPTLPDCLGRGIEPQYLTYDITDMAQRLRFQFINDEVTAVDFYKKEVTLKNRVLSYDFLLIASGSETNFYGNENIQKYAYKLDDANDVRTICRVLKGDAYSAYIIGGGGYTGVEVATNLRCFLGKDKKAGKVVIVERAPSILGPLPEWMKKYVSDNLKVLDVEVFVDSAIEKIDGEKVYVSGARVFDNAVVIWAAGVKTAAFIQNLTVDKNPQGRIKVDEFLRLNENCFAAGDAAFFSYNNAYLRMAMQFSIVEGDLAAKNIINSIKGRKLKKYRPIDMGYIIPMANNRSCGVIMGFNLKGLLPTIFHFIMCVYRSFNWRNKFGIIKGLIKGDE